MTAFQQALLIVIIFICTYTLIDRICKCIEHCATVRAFGKFQKNGLSTSFEKVEKTLDEIKKSGKNVETRTDKK